MTMDILGYRMGSMNETLGEMIKRLQIAALRVKTNDSKRENNSTSCTHERDRN